MTQFLQSLLATWPRRIVALIGLIASLLGIYGFSPQIRAGIKNLNVVHDTGKNNLIVAFDNSGPDDLTNASYSIMIENNVITYAPFIVQSGTHFKNTDSFQSGSLHEKTLTVCIVYDGRFPMTKGFQLFSGKFRYLAYGPNTVSSLQLRSTGEGFSGRC